MATVTAIKVTSVVCGAWVHAATTDGSETVCGIPVDRTLLRPGYRHTVDCDRCLEVLS